MIIFDLEGTSGSQSSIKLPNRTTRVFYGFRLPPAFPLTMRPVVKLVILQVLCFNAFGSSQSSYRVKTCSYPFLDSGFDASVWSRISHRR